MSLLSKTLHLLDDDKKKRHSKESLKGFETAFTKRKEELERLAEREEDPSRSESYRSELAVLDTLIIKTRQRLERL